METGPTVVPGAPFEADVDYLFCPVCRVHVPCRRLEVGAWEVLCPGCIGECGRCQCCLQRFCFGSREQFPPFDGSKLLFFGRQEKAR